MQIDFTTQIWKEGALHVSFSPELDVSSCGNSVDEARRNLEQAVAGFLEAAKERGTLQEILEEDGFVREDGKEWKAPDLLAMQKMRLAV